ncbi:MAG: Na+/H+ antiporter NhaA, partial [Candidatus Margulisbacteria bacterium]|nr:Na+/H+ antiporter NhaA [Candidatus Margulisiibacteriota bacterium]
MKRLFKDFFESEKIGGLALIFCTIFSLLLTNVFPHSGYVSLWHDIAWINDGLMTIFFLLIGVELKRELTSGELSQIKQAALPAIAALGGMVVPALIFALFNWGLPTFSGAGIPVATDIAFALAILSLVGKRVPLSIKMMLTALAVIDDLGAIFVIALFYSGALSWLYLGLAGLILVALGVCNRLGVARLSPYLMGGVVLWYLMIHSGIHATISGVMVAFMIPVGAGSERLERVLNKPVAFLILPLFALANMCLPLSSQWHEGLWQPQSLGIIFGLLVGKPVGIFLFSFVAVMSGICVLPKGLGWRHILGVGFLGGVGFTMSLFI